MSNALVKPLLPVRIVYIFATIIAFIFVIAFVWFMLWAVMTPLGASITPIANSYHNESWPLYDELNLAETFMSSFWQYLLLFAIVGLALWVWMESQYRGQRLQ